MGRGNNHHHHHEHSNKKRLDLPLNIHVSHLTPQPETPKKRCEDPGVARWSQKSHPHPSPTTRSYRDDQDASITEPPRNVVGQKASYDEQELHNNPASSYLDLLCIREKTQTHAGLSEDSSSHYTDSTNRGLGEYLRSEGEINTLRVGEEYAFPDFLDHHFFGFLRRGRVLQIVLVTEATPRGRVLLVILALFLGIDRDFVAILLHVVVVVVAAALVLFLIFPTTSKSRDAHCSIDSNFSRSPWKPFWE